MGKVLPEQFPECLDGRDAVVWTRQYSRNHKEHCKCDMLRDTLRQLSADRMVVGHTIQNDGVNGACADQVLRCAIALHLRHVHPL